MEDLQLSDLEQLCDQQPEVVGVALGHRVVAPPADLTHQLPQTVALELQGHTHTRRDNQSPGNLATVNYLPLANTLNVS